MKKTYTFATALFFFAFITAIRSQCGFTPSVTAVPTSTPGINYTITGSAPGVTTGIESIYITEFQQWFSGDSINYSFPGSGTYTVCYSVFDSATFCSDTACASIIVNGGGATNCSVSFSNIQGSNGTWNFTAHPFVAPGWTTSYSWNFGDGSFATGTQTSHPYANPGNYIVSLSMNAFNPADSTESCSSTSTQTITATITNACNVQGWLNAQPDSLGSLNYYIITNMVNASSNAGSTLYIQGGGTYYNADTVLYTFPSAGAYSVCFTVSDSTSQGTCYDSVCTTVNAGSMNATCSTGYTYNTNNAGNVVNFSSWASVPQNWLVTYSWNFGDGTYGGTANVTHTYANPGPYSVNLTMNAVYVYDSTVTCTAYFMDTVYVNNTNGTNCSINVYSQSNGNGAYTFNFTANSVNPSYPASINWTIDGTTVNTTDTMFNYTFTTNGNHNVCADVALIDSNGDTCYSSGCISASWYATCQASFYLWQDSLNPNVYFGYNTSTGNSLTYLWDFGDGTTSTQAYPYHNYAITGYYLMCLTVTDSSINCTHTYCDSAGVYRLMTGGISSMTILPTQTTTGVQSEQMQTQFGVAPNPLTEFSILHIESTEAKRLQITITNIVGQIVSSEIIMVSQGKNGHQFNTSAFASGLYFLTISDNAGPLKTIKLIK